ncbi:MAG: CDP-alcohol phosphatidyltransferase family protein [Anaerolineae bacterium]|nr:CDP-alcohol phosphatidyltransferase family protein [Anaerolineae bacterium]
MEQAKIKQYESFTDWLRVQAAVVTHPIARFLGKLGFHPNTITILGFALSAGVAIVIARGHVTLGGVLLLFTSSVDALDGALARVMGSKSRFGAFLDSTLDRFSEGALLLGLLAWLLPQGKMLEAYLVFVTLLGSVMVSYTRARAEGVGFACKVGILTRMERIVLLGIGLIVGWVRPMLILMAVLSWVTVFQRIAYVYRESLREP